MDRACSKEEVAFREEVRAFFRDNVPPETRKKLVEGRHLSKDEMVAWWRILNKKGWGVSHWPKEYGGTGWTSVQHYIFNEELQMHPAPAPLAFGVSMVGPVIYTFGNEKQKQQYLPRIAHDAALLKRVGAWAAMAGGCGMTAFFQNFWYWLPFIGWQRGGMSYEWAWFTATLAGILMISLLLMLSVAMIIYAERKLWAAFALRRGPNVVGPWGVLQSFAEFDQIGLHKSYCFLLISMHSSRFSREKLSELKIIVVISLQFY